MKKVLTCILCLLPFILFFGIIIPLFGISIAQELGTITEEAAESIAFILCIGAIVAVIAVYGVMIWLIVKTIRKKEFDTGVKVVWCICLYWFNIFAFPVYWFMYLRKE